MRYRLGQSLATCSFVIFVSFLISQTTRAQQKIVGVPLPTSTPEGVLREKDEDAYRIGPGDVLDIQFYNRPQLSGSVRVNVAGNIQLPLIDGDIRAACRTEEEVATEIATRYLKYQRRPHVTVLVREYASTPVAVVGAVDKPGRFQLTRRMRLLELLTVAGGPTDKAGGQIVVAHLGGAFCSSKEDQAAMGLDGYTTYSLKETLRAQEGANPWMEPGDIASITEADQAYVVGNVFKPQPVPLKEAVTVTQAIAMAGGILPATKSSGIRLIRRMPGNSDQKLIVVDLDAIKKHRAEDISLQANDIIDVPTSTGKKTLSSILNGLGAGMSSVPYIITKK